MDLMVHWQKVVSRLSELNNPQKVIFSWFGAYCIHTGH